MTELGERPCLLEVSFPLAAISREAAREKSIRQAHPSTFHLWWARRPLVACRAVLFGQLVSDPSAWPETFSTVEEQDVERQRLFRILVELATWENTNNEDVLRPARSEIARSFARNRIADGQGDERDAAMLGEELDAGTVADYLADVVPPVHDPFAGGGSIPLEAQRLGLRAIATDLNPVAVTINKAMIEIPPRFAGHSPIGPVPSNGNLEAAELKGWPRATGLAEDVRRYGKWIREEAFKRIGHLYPEVELPIENGGGTATVIAWLWARTVESPNPAFRGVHVPLLTTFFLSTKKGKEAWLEPVIEGRSYSFQIRKGRPEDLERIKSGTKLGRGTNFRCLFSDTPIEPDYVRAEGKAGRVGLRLVAIVAAYERKRLYLPASKEQEAVAERAQPEWAPDEELPENPRWFAPPDYGMPTYGDLFTSRQLVAMDTFSGLVLEARSKAIAEASQAGEKGGGEGYEEGGVGATAYGDALAVYLGLLVSRLANTLNSLCTWSTSRDQSTNLFSRQAIPMKWDFPEVNPFAGAAGDFEKTAISMAKVIDGLPASVAGVAKQVDAAIVPSAPCIINTDPPYYDNVGYADLSDFFYVWLRRSLGGLGIKLFHTITTPKAQELIADPYRRGGKKEAQDYFQAGITAALENITSKAEGPICIYYAFRQAEVREEGVSSTGWETFLDGLNHSGLRVTATLPLRTERPTGMKAGINALASSIVLVCRKRSLDAPVISRGEFRALLKQDLPDAFKMLQKGNIAPVDLAQASLGPGMAIFSAHSKVLEADGSAMSVRSALQLIHQLTDEVYGEEEGEFDRETRFATTWFESHGFDEGPYGEAETLATARAVSVAGVKDAGVLKSGAGKVRLYTRGELPENWDPRSDDRLTVWEGMQHLIKRLSEEGERSAAALLAKLGPMAEHARNLAYRLYTTCERKGWAEEAQAYNALVLAWPELEKLAGEGEASGGVSPQTEMFE